MYTIYSYLLESLRRAVTLTIQVLLVKFFGYSAQRQTRATVEGMACGTRIIMCQSDQVSAQPLLSRSRAFSCLFVFPTDIHT